VAEAIYNMIVHHSNRLHVGVADGCSEELEAPLFHIGADCIGQWRKGRNL
jgi:hypothetical protein